ncbi:MULTISPECIES: hypothetical protein [unclassified Mycolicibacterium]|uniref:hypothetical protein n=1 Tax=unclassified Mycolicibacterium TaxID=2636767 RepID=UPI001EE48F29|nr:MULTISPECIES: hypothetical protein [unclassified Mycolicibacterium]
MFAWWKLADPPTEMLRYLARILGEAAVVAGRTDTVLGERCRRIARRRGKKRAIVAVGRSILVIVWHRLADEDTRFRLCRNIIGGLIDGDGNRIRSGDK